MLCFSYVGAFTDLATNDVIQLEITFLATKKEQTPPRRFVKSPEKELRFADISLNETKIGCLKHAKKTDPTQNEFCIDDETDHKQKR